MLPFGKTQKKHPGDLPPTVPDLPPPPHVTPYDLMAARRVQSLLYGCTFVSHFIALAARL